MTSFLALSLNSATDDRATIYSLSIVECAADGFVSKRFSKFINPESPTDKVHFKYIKIDENGLNRAPPFPKVAEEIRLLLLNRVVVTYYPFQIDGLYGAFERYRLKGPTLLSTSAIDMADKVWHIGYNTETDVTAHLRINKTSIWDTLARARSHAIIAHCALRDMGINIEDWIDGNAPNRAPITPTPYRPPRPKRSWWSSIRF